MSENQTNTPETTGTEGAAPEVKLTRREKLLNRYNKAFAKHAELSQELQELASEINAIDLLASVNVGHEVYITVGRKEEAKEVKGVVIGVKEDEDGSKTYKVAYGSGFDSDIAVVAAGKIRLQPTPAPVEQAAEQAV